MTARSGDPGGAGRPGPTSAAGKARSAQNARKHGLNVQVYYDPELCAIVAAIACEIAPECKDFELIGLAHRIAEAQVDLMRVARARRDMLSFAMADPGYRVMDGGDASPASATAGRTDAKPSAGTAKLVAVLADAGQRLARLDRYERTALARRRRAIRAYDVAQRRAARRGPDFYKTN
jgi:hypothetical protein